MPSATDTSMFSLVGLDLPVSPVTGQYDQSGLELLGDFPPDFDFSMLDFDLTIESSTNGSISPSPGSGGLSFQPNDNMESRDVDTAAERDGGEGPPDTDVLRIVDSLKSDLKEREKTKCFSGQASITGRGHAEPLVDDVTGRDKISTANHGEISECIREIRRKLNQVEAIFSLSYPSDFSSERKRNTIRRPTKRSRRGEGRRPQKAQRRRKANAYVNVKALRVFINDKEFIWKQLGGHDGYWYTQGDADPYSGCELLTFSSEVSVELRPNLDWLPISVRWNEHTGQFEGFDELDDYKKLVVSEMVMLDILSDPVHQRGEGYMEHAREQHKHV